MSEYCKDHVTLCEDMAIVKTTVINLDKRINGSIDDINDHIKNGSKWRLAIIGVSATIIINIFIAVYWYGRLSERVDTLHSVIITNVEAKTK